MNLEKKLVAIAFVALMTILTIFGSKMELKKPEEQESILPSWTEDTDTIHIWYSDESLTDYLTAAATAFSDAEGVHVIPRLVSQSEYLENIYRESIEDGVLPDCYILSNDQLEKAYLTGLAVEVLDPSGICNEQSFSKGAISAVSYHGRIIGYPMSYETSALLYNRDYLREWARQQLIKEATTGEEVFTQDENGEAESVTTTNTGVEAFEPEDADIERYLSENFPHTMNDILNVADGFDAPEGVEGVMKWAVKDIFYNYWFVGNYMIVGGDAGDDGNNIDITNDETVQCLEFYESLNQFFSIEADSVNYESVIKDFEDGKIIFTIGTTDVISRLEEAEREGILTYDYGIARIPEISDELKSRSLSVTNAVVINGYSKEISLANRFATFIVSDYAGELYDWTGKVPANPYVYPYADNGRDEGRISAGDSAQFVTFSEEYADSIPLPKMMKTGNFWVNLEILFSKVWKGADVSEQLSELSEAIGA